MNILKENLLDLLALLTIASTVFIDSQGLIIGLWIYTSLVILSKLVGLFFPSLVQKVNKGIVTPIYFYHIVYLLSAAILIYTGAWYLAGSWLLIWLLSWISFRRILQQGKKTTN